MFALRVLSLMLLLLATSAQAAPEFRGLWVTRWDYVTARDIQTIFAKASDAGFGAVFFQVRGRADAFYRSSLEPWAEELSGTLGQDPGYDPLATAVEEGASRGLQVHAWINVAPMWRGEKPPIETTPRHIYLEHPEWIAANENGDPMQLGGRQYVSLSFGNPQARAHIVAVVEELVSQYAIAGVHLDYIRYSGSRYSHDRVSRVRYAQDKAARPQLSRQQWQRDQVTELVRQVYTVLQRHDMVLTAAVWHNNNLDVYGSRGYRDYYQDSHCWMHRGIIDAIVPMNYLRIDSTPSFAELAQDHVAHAFDRQVYMGMNALGRITEKDPSGAQLQANIRYARRVGADGISVFSYALIDRHNLWRAVQLGFRQTTE